MDIQRVRNLSTGILHTQVEHVYQDLETITGITGFQTVQLPAALFAIKSHLTRHLTDMRFFDGVLDTTHVGDVDVPVMDLGERDEFEFRMGRYVPGVTGVVEEKPAEDGTAEDGTAEEGV